ncbi:DEAD/DEAH box helicase [Methylacidiphilum caldifontis]|uniref:helicase-related protein n=1 Tax=Methylacidiphilum caldifontis TaxID=2795386 RepID=UPI001A8D3E19|nr:helicase-related protein [Methylacidiphilum caldifontis]QSR89203.1 DEAD/DEAH box helicase [Methylacidiphilum caldifontis]
MSLKISYQPGTLVKARGREWVVLPETRPNLLRLRPLGGSEDDATLIYLPLESVQPKPATFELPDTPCPGAWDSALLLRDALRLKLRTGAGPFRCFGNISVEPRAYQLVPLLMALKLETIRLLIADDVGIGKTIESGLIAREMLDRGEIERIVVICPPHLCEQWQKELASKFNIEAETVRTGTVPRLEQGLRPDESIFQVYPFTVVSLDYIKSDRRREDFFRACPDFVIIDEAHTCVQSSTRIRHQRYELIKGLAKKSNRHMIFLTATPHSGYDVAFYNLLALLDPCFSALSELPEGEERRHLREKLANHFVQRRRSDITEWRDSIGFPVRESREATYKLNGSWGDFFDMVLDYAQSMVQSAEGKTELERRMSWWAALALLRCISSSPAAAALALRTRLKVVERGNEAEQIAELDQTAIETVIDGMADDILTLNETVPAGTVESPEDAAVLRMLIRQAEKLRGLKSDPKIAIVSTEILKLLNQGFKPVIFCRYIATAYYVAEQLKSLLPEHKASVIVVTGELTPDQREERIEALRELPDGVSPVLVATDCLSEGVNLQQFFNAVVHYDLTWNPTRHEQREGRVDRFGQASKVVRCLMIYGENNPVDGAVLKVILRKAEKIRKELGITVPLPEDSTKVIDAIMKSVLIKKGRKIEATQQLAFDFGEIEAEVDNAWEIARGKMTRTVFAQRRLRPEEVVPEWYKAVSILGGASDVERFVSKAAERLGAPLECCCDHWKFPLDHLRSELRDRLEEVGLKGTIRVGFQNPVPSSVLHIHRTHPLVAILGDYIVESALEDENPNFGARYSAMFTDAVDARTIVYLLRLRYQITVEKRDELGRYTPMKVLLAEECLGVAIRGTEAPKILNEVDALGLLSLKPSRNMEDGQKVHFLTQALRLNPQLGASFAEIAERRAVELLADHRRVREASDACGIRYRVISVPPVDKIGLYVLIPMAKL